ncbi:type III secretion apparatus protein OrgA/MxiK [Chromobacterium phragmitis]|uniref:Type III secretion apparatus protein OrgA/MxiK n=2 Tax=Chromobacterium phragmitis TaxID=2202141 RepID=A0A344UDA5_9NEIS|nr:type III secretion apparatus protein OrgA/MxiK [Chromobacterium phragmitis]
MAEMNGALRTILFDPLSYLHPERLSLPPALSSPEGRRVVNDMLLAGYGLSTDWMPSPDDRSHRWWLESWRHLPQAAYLMGCQLRRAALAERGAILSLPGWAKSFAALSIADADGAAMGENLPGHDGLLLAGYGQLLAWRARMPEALRQRLPLLFPSWVDANARAPSRPDTLLLTLALQYAKRHPHFPPSGRD